MEPPSDEPLDVALKPLRHTHQGSQMTPTQGGLFPCVSERCSQIPGSIVDQFNEIEFNEFLEVVAPVGGGVKGSQKIFFGYRHEQF